MHVISWFTNAIKHDFFIYPTFGQGYILLNDIYFNRSVSRQYTNLAGKSVVDGKANCLGSGLTLTVLAIAEFGASIAPAT